MRLITLLLTALAATTFPSTHAITCGVGTLIPDANGKVDTSQLLTITCPTGSNQCITAISRLSLNPELPRSVTVTCAPVEEPCVPSSTVASPDNWAEIRCCSGDNCNKQGLDNINWADRTPNQGDGDDNPTIPSIPTTQPVTTQAPTQSSTNTRIRCREGSTIPSGTGIIGPDTDSWKSDTCQEGQSFCVTFFQRTDDRKFVMANCADRCTPSVFVTSPTQWIETTCCSGDNCNNDMSKLSQQDWGVRTANVTGSPATTAPNSGSGSGSPTSRGPFSAASSTCSSFVIMMLALAFATLVML